MPLQKERAAAAIRIVGQNGQPAVNGVPSETSTIFDVTVAPGGTLTFSPSTVNISVGDTVRWTWAHSGHSVTSGDSTACTADGQFCSPNNTNCSTCVTSNTGFVYEFTFTQAGSFSYHCCVHCAIGMIGAVNVSAASPTANTNSNCNSNRNCNCNCNCNRNANCDTNGDGYAKCDSNRNVGAKWNANSNCNADQYTAQNSTYANAPASPDACTSPITTERVCRRLGESSGHPAAAEQRRARSAAPYRQNEASFWYSGSLLPAVDLRSLRKSRHKRTDRKREPMVLVRPILFASKTAATPAEARGNYHDFSARRGKARAECGNGVYRSNCVAPPCVVF